jgi:hypothetical protein
MYADINKFLRLGPCEITEKEALLLNQWWAAATNERRRIIDIYRHVRVATESLHRGQFAVFTPFHVNYVAAAPFVNHNHLTTGFLYCRNLPSRGGLEN